MMNNYFPHILRIWSDEKTSLSFWHASLKNPHTHTTTNFTEISEPTT
jgi:hypothetical protein